MVAKNSSVLPPPNPEQRRVAAGQFERANQVIATGNYDYGIRLLLNCCKIDPANLIYRQTLRRTEKTKYKNNLHGSRFAWLTVWPARARVKAAKQAGDYLRVIDHCEEILTRNPWDLGAQMELSAAAEMLGLMDVAIWNLEQARQKHARDTTLNRALALLYEKRGNFTQAIALWDLIRKTDPSNAEAHHKVNELAANDTIARTLNKALCSGQKQPQRARSKPDTDQAITPVGAPTKEKSTEAASERTKEPSSARKEKLPAPQAESKQQTTASAAAGDASSSAVPRAPAPLDRLGREIAALRARIETDPTNPSPYLQLAWLHRRNAQPDQAREVLQQGLGPTGNHFDLAVELADLDIEPLRHDLAIAEAKLQNQPQDEMLSAILARLRKEINSRELDIYRRKAERYPNEKAHHFEMGLRLLRAGQFDEAIHELQTARSDLRFQWRALLYLGYCFKGRNNWRLAQRNFEEALQNLPANETEIRKEILFQLAQGAAEAGDLVKAADLGHELANEDFHYCDIGRLLDDWQSQLQQTRISR